jgi:osmotically inducible lipoprotein OsmB
MHLIHPGPVTTNARPRHRIRPEDTIRRHILAIKDRRLVHRPKEHKKEEDLCSSNKAYIVAVMILALGLAACGRTPGTRAVTGGLIGAGGGAAVGSAIGLGAGTGALVGGAGGAGAGALTGHR